MHERGAHPSEEEGGGHADGADAERDKHGLHIQGPRFAQY